MIRTVLTLALLTLALLTFALLSLLASPSSARSYKDCLGCHRKLSKGQVAIWKASAHGKKGVGCVACHGSDHKKIEAGQAKVDAKVCGRCHPQAAKEHRASRHGLGLHTGWGCTRKHPNASKAECSFCHDKDSAKPRSKTQCARFLKQSSAMRQVGCNGCHQVETSCASCHTNHATAASIVRDPAVCATCHMGPDHPQWEMWKTSKHGTLFAKLGKKHAPSCQTCHLAKSSHNVSHGLTMSPTGAIYPKRRRARGRKEMLAVCKRCHSSRFATRELERGDRVREQSNALVAQAKGIIEALHSEGLLDPMPKKRPAHPQRGKVLVLDGQMLYENTSHIERLFFTMKKFYLAQTVKGAYHQNPAYTHWYGNARLKMALVDIRAEASRLRRRPGKQARRRVGGFEAELHRLKRERLSDKISVAEYDRARKALLQRFVGGKRTAP